MNGRHKAPSGVGSAGPSAGRRQKGAVTPEVAAMVDEALQLLWRAWRLHCGLPAPQSAVGAKPQAASPSPPPPPPAVSTRADLPEQLSQGLWSEKRVRELTSLSHNEIHKRRLAGTFPNPEHIGGRRVAYGKGGEDFVLGGGRRGRVLGGRAAFRRSGRRRRRRFSARLVGLPDGGFVRPRDGEARIGRA